MSSLWVDVMNNSRVGRYMGEIERGLISRHLPESSQKVLDIGGGTGRWSAWMESLGHVPTLLELESYNLGGFKRSTPHLDAVQADAQDAPFADESFDAVIAVQVFDLLSKKARFMSEIHRILKPGGHMFISWTNKRSIKGLLYHRYSDLKGTSDFERFQIYAASHQENLKFLLDGGFQVEEALGYAWSLLPRAHNSFLVDVWAKLESGLRLNKWLDASPNVLLAARKE